MFRVGLRALQYLSRIRFNPSIY